MPKNKKGGKSFKRQKSKREDVNTQIEFKDHGQEYGQVTKMLGNGRVRVSCFDNKERLGIIRGKMRKRVWIEIGDVILISLRDFQDDKADVIGKYSSEEARYLKRSGEIPPNAKLGGFHDANSEDEDCAFDFDFNTI